MKTAFDELDEVVQEALLDWFNIERPHGTDKQRLADLFNEGKFWAWDCPTCGDRCYYATPDDWAWFQSTGNVDHASYPGSPDYYSARIVTQQCDGCRMSCPDVENTNLIGQGEPPIWADEGD